MLFSVPLLSSLMAVATAKELALYWGQASAGSQKTLGEYCQNSPGDIYLISFLTTFGSGRELAMNIAGYYDFFAGTQLINAPQIGQDIKTCQGLGKKILLSLGGAAGSYGFSSNADAEKVATELWNLFGGGSSATRPFGDAKIDGFDLDGENNIGADYYVPFVAKLRELYATDPSKQYLATAAPQCFYPDATVGKAVAEADLDYWFIQFYNNYCSLSGNQFNFDTWQNLASTGAPNRNVKLLVGLPGSTTAAGSGYIPIEDIKAKRAEFENSANFGGFMVWDASQANQNVQNGESFAQGLEQLLQGGSGGSPAPVVSTTTSPAQPTQWWPVTSAAEPITSTSQPAQWWPVTSAAEPTTSQHQPWYPSAIVGNNANVTVTYAEEATTSSVRGGPGYNYEGAGQDVTVTEVNTFTTSDCTTSSTTPAPAPAPTTVTRAPDAGAGAGAHAAEQASARATSADQQPASSSAAANANPNANASPKASSGNAPAAGGASGSTIVTSTLTSTVTSTNTITSATPEPSESCYTISNEVVVVKTKWNTLYTTLWI